MGNDGVRSFERGYFSIFYTTKLLWTKIKKKRKSIIAKIHLINSLDFDSSKSLISKPKKIKVIDFGLRSKIVNCASNKKKFTVSTPTLSKPTSSYLQTATLEFRSTENYSKIQLKCKAIYFNFNPHRVSVES